MTELTDNLKLFALHRPKALLLEIWLAVSWAYLSGLSFSYWSGDLRERLVWSLVILLIGFAPMAVWEHLVGTKLREVAA